MFLMEVIFFLSTDVISGTRASFNEENTDKASESYLLSIYASIVNLDVESKSLNTPIYQSNQNAIYLL